MTIEVIEILLVEDNPGDVKLTEKVLAKIGLSNALSVVTDGEQALDYLHQRGGYEGVAIPGLLLLDINLPKVSGHEVLAAMKAHPDLQDIPVVMLTSSDAEQDRQLAESAGASAYLTKPPRPLTFLAALQQVGMLDLALIRGPGQSSP
ncbi:MAG: response regulator [Myxococcota bacterium]